MLGKKYFLRDFNHNFSSVWHLFLDFLTSLVTLTEKKQK